MPIKVLIIDDSAVVRELITHILATDPAVEVVGVAFNGEEALEALPRLKPDVLTMDIQMPKMDGIEATRQIMRTHPVPIVIVSAQWNPGEETITFEALEAGAVALVEKPRGIGHPQYKEDAKKLLQTVKAMSEVRVIRRWARPERTESKPVALPPIAKPRAGVKLIAIGVSTGGPPVLQHMLQLIPPTLSVPIVIVQHIAAGFLPGLVEWLEKTTSFPTRIAADGEKMQAGHAYLAPDDRQMGVDSNNRVLLLDAPPENGLRPAVSYLFRSVAAAHGASAIGVLLTGMGRDGASELKLMRDAGALTIAQDKTSSIVHGMPGVAIELGAAMHVLPPDQIAALLTATVAGG